MLGILLKFIVVLLVVLPTSIFATDIKLHLVYGNEQAFPYMMGTGPTIPEAAGIAIDIIEQAAKDIDVKVEFSRLPDKRLFLYLQDGIADGNFIQSFNTERMKYGRYPMKSGKPDQGKRITTLKYYLYKKRESDFDFTRDSLAADGSRVAVVRGYSIINDLRMLGATVVEVGSVESLFKMLEFGRVDMVALQDTEGDYRLKDKGVNNIEKLYPPLKTKHYYLMLSHQFVMKHPEIADKLWARISEIRDRVTNEKRGQYEESR